MATNPIGAGTCNFSINMPSQVRSIIGRVAFPQIQSGQYRGVGEYGMHLMVEGLRQENPTAAIELEQAWASRLRVRQARIQVMASALLVMVCYLTLISWTDHDEDDSVRRARGQRVRVVRSVRGGGARGRCELEAA